MKNRQPPGIELGASDLKLSVPYHLSFGHRVTANFSITLYVSSMCMYMSDQSLRPGNVPEDNSLPFSQEKKRAASGGI